jgi:hypothetical protein
MSFEEEKMPLKPHFFIAFLYFFEHNRVPLGDTEALLTVGGSIPLGAVVLRTGREQDHGNLF